MKNMKFFNLKIDTKQDNIKYSNDFFSKHAASTLTPQHLNYVPHKQFPPSFNNQIKMFTSKKSLSSFEDDIYHPGSIAVENDNEPATSLNIDCIFILYLFKLQINPLKLKIII